MSDLTGDLLREVANVQRNRTIQDIRDAIERIKTTEYDSRSYSTKDLPASGFKAEVVAILEAMRNGER